MHIVWDRAAQKAALHTIQELIDCGLAGNDVYDRSLFIVDPPDQTIRDRADVALDILGASMVRDGAYGASRKQLQCHLPGWVRAEFGLDLPGAPELITPLASRGLSDPGAVVGSLAMASLDRLIDEVSGR